MSSAGRVTGIVGEDIIVLPDMGTDHLDVVMRADGVVAEAGGELAHLVIVCKGLGKTVMIMPGACSILYPGLCVTLLPERCEIRVDFDTAHGSDTRS